MPFTPTVRIKNGVTWRGDAAPGITEIPEIMPLPQVRPRRKGDKVEPPPTDQEPLSDQGPSTDTERQQVEPPPDIQNLPPPDLPPQPRTPWPKLSVQDQLAMALAAQMMPDDPSIALVGPNNPSMRRLPELNPKTVPDAGNLRKRLLMPQAGGLSTADAFRAWMQQSAAPDRSFPPESELDPLPTRRNI